MKRRDVERELDLDGDAQFRSETRYMYRNCHDIRIDSILTSHRIRTRSSSRRRT